MCDKTRHLLPLPHVPKASPRRGDTLMFLLSFGRGSRSWKKSLFSTFYKILERLWLQFASSSQKPKIFNGLYDTLLMDGSQRNKFGVKETNLQFHLPPEGGNVFETKKLCAPRDQQNETSRRRISRQLICFAIPLRGIAPKGAIWMKLNRHLSTAARSRTVRDSYPS